ncbi:sigma-70 family RNA polymerase sigma factor [Roseibacillus persicicus]|uniref:sigma-70 family RNA polymerase sigma factor n=1 Tax=Roseibacillus persicicus TaxID=454148 RepID=UPI00398ACBE7
MHLVPFSLLDFAVSSSTVWGVSMAVTQEISTETSSFEQVLASEELRRSLLQFIVSRVRDPHLAEDLTQDVLVKAFAKSASLREEERVVPWVFRIARSHIADHYRRGRAASSLREGEKGYGWLVDEQEVSYFPEILSNFLRGVVEGLPPIYRDALRFTDCEGRSQVELARREGISVSGAKSRVQRARAEVRAAVERCCFLDTDPYGGVVEVEPRPDYCPD